MLCSVWGDLTTQIFLAMDSLAQEPLPNTDPKGGTAHTQ